MQLLRTLSLALVVATFAACSGDDSATTQPETFTFGEADVRAAVTGDFTGTLTISGKAATPLKVHLDKAPVSTTKAACGNRSLTDPQCITVSTMQLVGTVWSDDKTFDAAAVTGTFDVYGTDLRSGSLRLVAGSRTLDFSFDAGTFKNGRLLDGADSAGGATLAR